MTQRQSSNLSYILVGVVAVVAVVVLLTNNPARLEGAVTAISGPADSFSPFCVDDDDKNVYSKFIYNKSTLGKLETHCPVL